MTKLLDHPEALCNMIRRLAVEAGNVTLEYFDDAGYQGADVKGDGSPVTLADQAAEAVIEKALKDITLDIPMVGEEAVSEGRIPDLSGTDYYWMVDPLDGTKEFISGSGDYTVNIALIKVQNTPLSLEGEGRGEGGVNASNPPHPNPLPAGERGQRYGVPVLGVVYAPVPGELYAGHGAGTAIRWMEDTGKDKPIRVRAMPPQGLTVVASKSHGSGSKLDDYLSQFKVEKILKRGSSLKICAVAAGKADLYPRFGPTCEWDTAAGHAVLNAAGGALTNVDGSPFIYGKAAQKFLNPEFIAKSAEIAELEAA